MKYILLLLLLIALLWTGHDVIVENEMNRDHCQLMTERYLIAEQYQSAVNGANILVEEGDYIVIRIKKID